MGDGGPPPEDFINALSGCGADAATVQKAKALEKQYQGAPPETEGDAFMASLSPNVANCMHSLMMD